MHPLREDERGYPAYREGPYQLDQHLSIFPKEKEFDENKISADVRKGNLIIRQLSDLLAK